MIDEKPDPDQILRAIQEEEKKSSSGKLKIFFGMAAGVGKTYAMLQEAHERLDEGVNVVIGTINTHGRQETEKVLEGLPIIPEKWIKFKDKAFQELDLEKILEIRPQLVLIDELAHTNVPGSKHLKRWQDVVEILDDGIDVYTTLNVQHLESRKDIVESVTGISIFETVPDLILERATNIEIVDIPPGQLLQRLKEGKVYLGDQSMIAAQNFFQEDHLTALREIALRFTAEKVDHDLHGLLALGRGWKTRERLMVAVSSAPSSQQLIRAVRLLAFELDAPWIVVNVDTGIKLRAEDQTRLNRHLQLAKELGAEVVIINDLDVAIALDRLARQRSITRVIIGRPTKRSLFRRIFFTSFIDRLAEENKEIDILILRQDKLVSVYKQTFPTLTFTSSMTSYWIVLSVGFFVTLMGYFLSPLIGYKGVGDVFLVTILTLSLLVGRGPILLAALLSALSWDYLFIPPLFSLIIQDFNDILLVLLYFFTALIVGVLNTRVREKDLFLYKREERVEYLYEMMREIAKSPNFQSLRLNVEAKLKMKFDGEFDILVKGLDNQLLFDSHLTVLNEETDRAAALWSFRNGKIAGWSTDTLPSAKAIYFPIQFSKETSGILGYAPKNQKPLTHDEQSFFQSVAEQLGIYLDRYIFEERTESQNYMHQVEKLHTSIFHSLSKGFYAPLEKIFTINQQLKQIVHDKEEKKLADEIDSAGKNLKMIVDNILTLSQLESGYIQFEKKNYSIKKLIEESLSEVQSLINGHLIHMQLPEQDLFLDCNFHLMKIAFKNILVNAIEYSPGNSSIDIVVKDLENQFKFSVSDQGTGVAEEVMPFIFEKFYRASGAKLEGIGLGLTIVKTVVDLHQGQLEVKKREEGGTEVSIILPK